jgi:hypothetical protein
MGVAPLKRWALFGWLCAVWLAGLCLLGPVRPSTLIDGRETVLVPPRSGGRGVVVQRLFHGFAALHVIDADLSTPGVTVRVHAANPSSREWGWSVADARSVADWCRITGAVAGVNGGFFGEEVRPGRKEIIGLLKVAGKTYARAPLYRARAADRVSYAHSTFGVVDSRRPMVAWVTSSRRSRDRLLAYPRPVDLRDGSPWKVDSALSGGPRLIHLGRNYVADRDERLVSVGALPRTFLGLSRARRAGGNRLVLATASAMSFEQAAGFLQSYFQSRHGVPCDEAMGLDGGHAAQLAYRSGDQILSARGVEVTVPTTVLIHDTAAGVRTAKSPLE